MQIPIAWLKTQIYFLLYSASSKTVNLIQQIFIKCMIEFYFPPACYLIDQWLELIDISGEFYRQPSQSKGGIAVYNFKWWCLSNDRLANILKTHK